MKLAQRQQRHSIAFRYPASSNQINAQRANQLSQQFKLASRILINKGKNYAYLAEVYLKEFNVYNEKDDKHEQNSQIVIINTNTNQRYASRLQCVSQSFDHKSIIIFIFCGHLLEIPSPGIYIRLSAAQPWRFSAHIWSFAIVIQELSITL